MAENKGKRLLQYVPDYVVFDLETTGISVKSDAIVEISAVKVQGGKVIDTYSTLVNPERSIPARATAVNGISNEMVKDAPVIAEAMKEFLDFIKGFVLVGHNIHSFDMKFIYQAAEQLFDYVITNDYIDTLPMSRTCLPELKHHKLVDISSHFQIKTDGAHRALNDCIMNQQCFEELGKLQAKKVLMVCPRCGGELLKRSGKFGSFIGCSNYPQCKYTESI